MSSRSSFFLTSKGDHWYEDYCYVEKQGGKITETPNVFISIGDEDIISMEYCEIQKTWFFEIDGDSELANAIRKCRQ